MSDEITSNLDRAAEQVRGGGCVVLTGAGISVASGIPHFRAEGGLWDRYDPMEYATAMAWRSDPVKVWKLFREMGAVILRARPNPAHLALAEMERKGWVEAVVTQNIDGLHQAAGSRNVIEFHGNSVDIYCESCGRTFEKAESLAFLEGAGAVLCPECEGNVRPSVVLFGEPIPQDALRVSATVAASCRTMIVVGTSAVVAPASLLPMEAASHGATIVEVNPEETELTARADVVLRGPAEEVVPALAARAAEPP
jgi:NAD-dependent deacetylase